MKFAKRLLLVFAFTLVVIHFVILVVLLMTRDWSTPIFNDWMPPSFFLLPALCAILGGLTILFTIAYIVSKVYDRNKYD